EIARRAAAPAEPHLVAGVLEVLRVEELGRAAADHLGRRKPEDRVPARAEAQQVPLAIHHQNEAGRDVKDPLVTRARWSFAAGCAETVWTCRLRRCPIHSA